MYGFKEKYIVVEVPQSGDIRKLVSGLTYTSQSTKEMIYVPEGFHTDLGSIPQALQGIFPKDGKAMFAYVLHDYLYFTGIHSQSMCDDLLEEAMEHLGVGWFTRKSVRAGLAIGGFIAYNNHRKRK